MTWLAALVVVGVAGFLTGMTGFGFSVLSVPLLLLIYPPTTSSSWLSASSRWTSAALLLTSHLGAPGSTDDSALRSPVSR